MKILITGGSGLLGQYLNMSLSASNEILTLYNNKIGNCGNYNSAKVNITDKELMEKIFSSFQPDVVVHAAAISSPQNTQALPSKLVYKINVTATENIAMLCKKNKSKLIYTSTDLVYAGYRGSMLKENAKIIPVSLYAETKFMGEKKIRETFENYIILRTALLYGFGLNGSTNNFQKMYVNFKEGKKVKLFYDQFRTPLSLFDAAAIIKRLCESEIKNEILNFGGRERVSRVELGELLCEAAGFDKNLIEKISLNDITDIPQAADVSLNTDKLQSFGIKQKSIKESIEEILNNSRID